MHYPQSICNAGLLNASGGFVSVIKNQNLTLCGESANGLEEFKRLYRVDFDSSWGVVNLSQIRATLDDVIIEDDMGLEDARLFRFRGDVWMYATSSGHSAESWPCFGKLDSNEVALVRPKYEANHPQKNWMPFEVDGNLYLEYSVNPHIVISYDVDSAECDLVGQTSFENKNSQLVIHGGAPAARYNDSYFLGLANTQESFWYQKRYYAALFYLFESRPPFRVTHVTRLIKIGTYKTRVQYVAGMVMASDRHSLLLSMGVDEIDNYIVELKLSDIENELKHT